MKENDKLYMLNAIELAKSGIGAVNPNPLVGAIIVKNDKIIGRGYHKAYGTLHAERNALASAIEDPKGATMYVTLEPCCHYGKTPPCTDAIIESGISRVVIGSRDPNPLVSGKGSKILKDAGIDVSEDFLIDECDSINKIFFHYIKNNTPYVTMKYAMTQDGKIATYSGKSKWITDIKSREHTHYSRNQHMAIMVGLGTVLADDPELTCRLYDGISPIRIICDSNLRTPLDSKLVTSAKYSNEKMRNPRTIIATTVSDKEKIKKFSDMGVTILTTPKTDTGKVNLISLMDTLGKMGIDSILLEGGGQLNWAALSVGIVQRVQTYIAPKIFGGEKGKGPVSGIGIENPKQAIQLANTTMTKIGQDFLLESEVIPCSQE